MFCCLSLALALIRLLMLNVRLLYDGLMNCGSFKSGHEISIYQK